MNKFIPNYTLNAIIKREFQILSRFLGIHLQDWMNIVSDMACMYIKTNTRALCTMYAAGAAECSARDDERKWAKGGEREHSINISQQYRTPYTLGDYFYYPLHFPHLAAHFHPRPDFSCNFHFYRGRDIFAFHFPSRDLYCIVPRLLNNDASSPRFTSEKNSASYLS